MLLPDGEWDSTGRFLPGTEDCKWRLGLFGYRPLPCVTCIAHAAIGVPYTPVRSCQTRSTRSSGLGADGYVRKKALSAPRGCQRLGRVGSATSRPSRRFFQYYPPPTRV